jgi:hypothetical protein
MSREWTQHDYQKSRLTGNLKKGKNEAVPEGPGKMGYIYIYIAMSEGDLRMGEWINRRQWNMEVGRRRQTF